HRRPSSGLRRRVDRHRHLHRPWQKSRSCIKAETGPPYGGRPDEPVEGTDLRSFFRAMAVQSEGREAAVRVSFLVKC
ncbi:hypothetical protein, partial [Paracoccus siganidrum]